MRTDVIVVGAGMAGAVVTNRLREAGASVRVLDKARGSGGRMSSKRLALNDGREITVDLGCPFVESQSAEYRRFLEQLVENNVLLPSQAEHGQGEWVVQGRSSLLTRYLLGDADIEFGARVSEIRASNNGEGSERWALRFEQAGESRIATAEHIVITAPPEQAQALLPEDHPFQRPLQGIHLIPQWVCAFVLSNRNEEGDLSLLPLRSLAQKLVAQAGVDKVIVENDKPGRDLPSGMAALTLHFTPGWSQAHIDEMKDNITGHARELMQQALEDTGGAGDLKLLATHVHRWLYSQPGRLTLADQRYLNDGQGLSLCGDYFGASEYGGLERAFLSASALAEVLQSAGSLNKWASHA